MSTRAEVEFRVGLASCGVANGARPVHEAVERAVREARRGVAKAVGCGGMCHREPLLEVVDERGHAAVYTHVTEDAVPAIVRRHLRPKGWLTRLRWIAAGLMDGGSRHGGFRAASRPVGVEGTRAATPRIVLENCGRLDPLSLDDALAHGGYAALVTCVERLTPEEVVETITASGLRGRGGAGFPTGRKWSLARREGAPRYVIANGDEGDPGAFMDRLVLESDPHRVVEGLAIAAYAVGAEEGFFYVRAEYPLAVRRVREAIRQAEARGLLGERALGGRLRLRLEVREGAGAFVCGEETALIASLEGRRGMPRLRPPYPVEMGFRGRPTVINNVETLACVPWILRHGPEAFASLGTVSSKGTKVFALAGKVRHGGLIEVPMGVTVREIVEDLGGGVPKGRTLKAVQLGGPSGGCLPASLGETPVDYEALDRSGAIMGSGGLVVLDDRDCMVEISRFFLRFTCRESCGKCTFCRIGTKRMLEILDRLCAGAGREEDLGNLAELADRVSRASLCGLGQTAPNPVTTAMRYFRGEFEAHVREKRCPAGRCTALSDYRINDSCIGCTLCAQVCPVHAIEYRPHERHAIDLRACTRCNMCFEVCEDGAVEVVSRGRVSATSPRAAERAI
ncbi:MAG TPA: NADH-ubiquinone oxidoreductase-F iron-sulfur binding region domain-containing protein [Vicinamibacteria bacterium]|nr:NADH-ubiquinone oxidoreductase-F iron-sulfur binding region domain-containing protein [Vicinamibacteria bacterium]